SEHCCTRSLVRVLVYWPKPPSSDPLSIELVSNRTEFVMLKTSQANFRLKRSVTFQDLARLASIPKKPWPRKVLRLPASPGNAKRSGVRVAGTPVVIETPATTAAGSEKAMGAPVEGSWKRPDLTGAVFTMKSLKRKLFVKPRVSTTLKGKALVHRPRPDNCHPPITASSPVLALLPSSWPRPKGNW